MNKLFKSNNANQLYLKALRQLLNEPDQLYSNEESNNSNPAGKLYSEMINTKMVLTDPRDRFISVRNMSMKYMMGEFIFYMKGSNLLKDISKYSSFWNKISDDGVHVNSGYGYKMFSTNIDGIRGALSQYELAITNLLRNINSKRAVVLINTPSDSRLDTKDTPCTMFLQFNVIHNKLHMTTYMRSNDIFFGVPYDIGFFTMLHEFTYIILKYTKYPEIRLGSYTHSIGNLHMYYKDRDKLTDILEEHGDLAFESLNPLQIERLKELHIPFPEMTINTYKQLYYLLKFEENTKNFYQNKLSDLFLVAVAKYAGLYEDSEHPHINIIDEERILTWR